MRSDNGTKVLFYPLVLSLGKPISLRVKCSGQILFDPELLGDGFPKVRGETGVSIADDFGRETEPSVYVIEV